MEYYFPSSFYELYRQYSSSSIPIATHTHALALFVLYLSVRFYRSQRSVAAASAGAVGTVKNDNINNSTDESKSSTSRLSHSCSSRRKSQSQETAFLDSKSSDDDDDDDNDDGTLLLLSQIEKDESLQQQSGSSTSTSRTKSTLAERRRFLIANKNNLNGTIQQLRSYIEWKNNHIDKKVQIKSTGDKDYDIWVESSLTAMKICDGEVENIVLPRIIRTHSNSNSNSEQHYIDRDGYRTFCVTPALMDNNLAKGSTYTQAVAIYLDRCLDPSENEMITILFDCRAGTGWSNNHVMKLIPFLKHFLKVLPPLVPERLQKAIVYPVPYTFTYIWSMLSKGLDPTTSKRVCILHGQCKIVAPPPSEQMKVHLYEDHMEELESSRIAGFKI
jgi:hypothetical protein